MIPPGLDVPYFQAKSLLPPLSALWSPTLICLSSGIFFQLWEERKVNWPDSCIASTLKAFPSCPVSYNTDKMSRRPKSTKSNLRAFDHSLFKNHEKRVCWLQLLTVHDAFFFPWHEYAMGKTTTKKKTFKTWFFGNINVFFWLFMCFLCTNDKLSNRVTVNSCTKTPLKSGVLA